MEPPYDYNLEISTSLFRAKTTAGVRFIKSPIQINDTPESRKKLDEQFHDDGKGLTLFWNPHTGETDNYSTNAPPGVKFIKSPIQINDTPEYRKKLDEQFHNKGNNNATLFWNPHTGETNFPSTNQSSKKYRKTRKHRK